MNPAFAATKRRLSELQKEWERLRAAKELLLVVQQSDALESTKSWVVNAAISAGVSGLYTGMEEILRGLLSAVDGYAPSGERSHQDILDQASAEVSGIRPEIISDELYAGLMGLKGFRHFERHNYRFRFDNDQVIRNEMISERIVTEFVGEIERFIQAMSPSDD